MSVRALAPDGLVANTLLVAIDEFLRKVPAGTELRERALLDAPVEAVGRLRHVLDKERLGSYVFCGDHAKVVATGQEMPVNGWAVIRRQDTEPSRTEAPTPRVDIVGEIVAGDDDTSPDLVPQSVLMHAANTLQKLTYAEEPNVGFRLAQLALSSVIVLSIKGTLSTVLSYKIEDEQPLPVVDE